MIDFDSQYDYIHPQIWVLTLLQAQTRGNDVCILILTPTGPREMSRSEVDQVD